LADVLAPGGFDEVLKLIQFHDRSPRRGISSIVLIFSTDLLKSDHFYSMKFAGIRGPMKLFRFNEENYQPAYGILCSRLHGKSARSAVTPTFCRIPVGGSTQPHGHYEGELFYILQGAGTVAVGDRQASVRTGDLVQIPAFESHQLRNTGAEELHFLSVYSDDADVPRPPASALVTAAPPTPNGSLHLGHISGPYLAADILARALRDRGVDVRTHTGTDDHQNYVGERARALGESSSDFQARMRARISESLGRMQIGFDEVLAPSSDERYQDSVRAFARKVIGRGLATRERIDFPFDEEEGIFLFDALIEGQCPRCEAPSHGGCESCGIVVLPHELRSPRSSRTGKPVSYRPAEVYTFALDRFLPAIAGDLARLPLPPRLRRFVSEMQALPQGKVLLTVPATSEVGILLPELDQRIHVWFEMAAHYESFAREARTWVHAFGFDNSFHYLLFIPALLRALDSRAKLPDAVLTNEFLLLEGRKFSTSRAHAIWADEFEGNVEHLRFFLSLNRPAMAERDFVRTRFDAFSQELRSKLDALNAITSSDRGEADPRAIFMIERATRDLELFLSPEHFDSQRAAMRLQELIDVSYQWRHSPASLRAIVAALSRGLRPFMPNEAERLRRNWSLS
jgi:methionyl-tRNA synthetase